MRNPVRPAHETQSSLAVAAAHGDQVTVAVRVEPGPDGMGERAGACGGRDTDPRARHGSDELFADEVLPGLR